MRDTVTLSVERNNLRGLSEEELDGVSGGMKWDHNHVSPNVIDARGGQISVGGWTFTIDVNGKVSSVTVG